MRKWIILIVLLTMSACSMNKEQKKNEIDEASSNSDFTINNDVLIIEDSTNLELEKTVKRMSNVSADSIYDDQSKIEDLENEVAYRVSDVEEEQFDDYIVNPGDTLMLIAFKIYRNSGRWKHISMWNEDLLKGRTKVFPGEILKFIPEDSSFQWPPNGTPYLILKDDDLQKISNKVYQDNGKHWRNIWENNKVQIYDPNIIFAGFTLYYLPIEELSPRGPANL